jgi:phenylalanine-4-hydroxylase
LLDKTVNTDFAPIYAALVDSADIPIEAILPEDVVFSRGTQRHVTG